MKDKIFYFKKMSDTPILRRFLPHYVSEDICGIAVQPWRNNQLKYVQQQKQNSKQLFCCIDIPITLLLSWETIKKKTADFKSFVRLLNERIPTGGFAIKDTAGRIEERPRVKCALISHQFKTASGRQKKKGFVEWQLEDEYFFGGSTVS